MMLGDSSFTRSTAFFGEILLALVFKISDTVDKCTLLDILLSRSTASPLPMSAAFFVGLYVSDSYTTTPTSIFNF